MWVAAIEKFSGGMKSNFEENENRALILASFVKLSPILFWSLSVEVRFSTQVLLLAINTESTINVNPQSFSILNEMAETLLCSKYFSIDCFQTKKDALSLQEPLFFLRSFLSKDVRLVGCSEVP